MYGGNLRMNLDIRGSSRRSIRIAYDPKGLHQDFFIVLRNFFSLDGRNLQYARLVRRISQAVLFQIELTRRREMRSEIGK
jgi:hypothetical protein